MDKPSEEDDVEKEVVFLAKNFRKFLKVNNSGKPFNRGKFSSPKGDRKKDGKDSQSTPKESLASSVMDMDKSRENVLII